MCVEAIESSMWSAVRRSFLQRLDGMLLAEDVDKGRE
jgi:hypothetical protein